MKRILILMMALLFPCLAAADVLPLTDGENVKDRFASNPRNVKNIGDPHVLEVNGLCYIAGRRKAVCA